MPPFVELFQQYAPLVTILAGVAGVLAFAFRMYQSSHNKQVRALNDQIDHLRQQLDKYEGKDPELLRQLDEAKAAQATLQTRLDTTREEWKEKEEALRGECERGRLVNDTLTAELETAREELSQRDRREMTRTNLVKKALRLEGRVWERKALHGIPRFRPLHERHAAVISVLNLKGGVGKTTVSAHLGAAFAAKGYRVLLVDLDLQGSLSSMFVHESILKQLSAERRLLQHFLTHTAERRKANLLEFCRPILDGKSAIVPTADSMVYAELNLTMQWLLRLGRRDTRFLLRRALHQKRVTSRFDMVVLDCPPLFNTCCVNALAASDYVLIPVVPSNKAAERVPLLLDRLKGLCRVINPDLQVTGALLNRTRGTQLTTWEQDLWHGLLDRAKDQWKSPVPAFQTFIRQTTEVRDSEQEFTPPAPGSELHDLFCRLAAELEERLPVTVAELQLLLSDLAKFLRASESAKVAGELEYIGAKLAPFRDFKLKAFADFLVKAEEYSRGALAPKPSRAGGKSKVDPAAIEQACQRVLQLYNQAIDPSVTLEQIESAVQTLQDLDPPKARLDELARQLGFTQKFKAKADVVKAIRQRILGRKGSFDRVNA